MDNRATTFLPRFDSPSVGDANHLVDFEVPECVANLHHAEAEALGVDPATNQVEELEAAKLEDARQLKEDIELALQQFSDVVHRIEAGAPRKVAAAVQDILRRVFPRLASACLVEEFALHVPDLMQSMPLNVSVKAAPHIAEKLQSVAADMENWPPDWTIGVAENLSDSRIELSWESGGLSYDADEVLAAAMTQLGLHNLENLEG